MWAGEKMEETKKLELNKIYCMDALEFLPKIKERSVDFILTDPPFNVGLDYSDIDDNIADEEYSKWCFNWISQLYRIIKEGSYVLIFTGDKKLFYIMKSIYKTGFTFHHFFKWHKPTGQRGLSGTVFFYRTELAFILTKGKANIKKINRKILYSDTLSIPETNKNQSQDGFLFDHPAKRPTKLYRKIIEGFSKEGDLILDCFMGSGTTAVACKQTNRNFIGCDISQEYVDIANKRLKQGVLTSISSTSKDAGILEVIL
jgi:site-specific DNA-methyltransferase (adenine-specific)